MKKYYLTDGTSVMVQATTETPSSTAKILLLEMVNAFVSITEKRMVTASGTLNYVEWQQISELASHFDAHWMNIHLMR